MTFTIMENKTYGDNGYVWITSKDKRFIEAWGGSNRTSRANLFTTMNELTSWANNQLNEEALFEVEG